MTPVLTSRVKIFKFCCKNHTPAKIAKYNCKKVLHSLYVIKKYPGG